MNLPRFSLRQLQYLVTIAEAGTLSEAATRLHVSQPALSQALTDLERALKVQLAVRRKAHGITLTPSGTQVLRQARQLLRLAEDLESEASGEGSLTGVLSLGCYVTLAPTALPPLLQGFSALHPQLTLDFTEGTQDVLQQRLLNGELDLAILYDMEVLPETARAVLCTTRPHILLPADHPMADQPTVSLRDLAPEPMVLLDAPPSSHNTLAIYQRLGVVPHVRYRPTTFEVTRALVGRGMGYALLVQRPANDRTYEGFRVVIKEIAEPVGEARVLLTWPKSIRLNRRAEEFIRYCRDSAALTKAINGSTPPSTARGDQGGHSRCAREAQLGQLPPVAPVAVDVTNTAEAPRGVPWQPSASTSRNVLRQLSVDHDMTNG